MLVTCLLYFQALSQKCSINLFAFTFLKINYCRLMLNQNTRTAIYAMQLIATVYLIVSSDEKGNCHNLALIIIRKALATHIMQKINVY